MTETMTRTGSGTIDTVPKVWRVNQTPVTNQEKHSSVAKERETNFGPLFRSLHLFLNWTGDGGAMLDPRTSPSFAWSIRTQFDRVIRILPRGMKRFTLMSQQSMHSAPSAFPSAGLQPHLEALGWIENATGLSQERIGRLVGVTRQTIINWQKDVPIKDGNRRRIFAVRDVLERASHRHPTREQLTAWLDTPRGADGRTPAELLAANEINRARLLAVSSPSSGLKPPPKWVNHPVPDAFRSRGEHRQEAWSPDADNKLGNLIRNENEGTDEDGEDLPL